MNEQVWLGVAFDVGAAPAEFQILKSGLNPTRKGDLLFGADEAVSVMADYESGGVDLPLDYDHAMADPSSRPRERVAAGWFRPEVRDDGSLWAADVRWTPAGRAAVEASEYRYTSLWGDVEEVMGTKKGRRKMRLTRLRNVALTNTPATIGTMPLVASDDGQGAEMSDYVLLSLLDASTEAEAVERIKGKDLALADVAGALGCDVDAIGAAARALKLRADAGDAAVAELERVKAERAASERRALIATLSEAGKLPPSLHAWAETQSIESLRVFGEHAPRLVEPVAAPNVTSSPSASLELTDEEKLVAQHLGLRLEDVANYKAAQSGKES